MKPSSIHVRLAVAALLAGGAGCSDAPPRSFEPVSSSWFPVEVRQGLAYERAWSNLFNILSRDFDIEFASKDDGYIRTAWTYTWEGAYDPGYRVRVTGRFSEKRDKVEIKAEAGYLHEKDWISGVDSRLLATLKTDLMGTIGRTTR